LGTEVLTAAFSGYNVCVFAYGQTSSGKTYTMMGDCMHEDTSMSYTVEVSYLEIYNERVRDLLRESSLNSNGNSNSGSPTNVSPAQTQAQQYTLKVREDAKSGCTYVQGLSAHRCTKFEQLIELIQRGNATRTTAATRMNDLSSRSHAIFTITFSQVCFPFFIT
jgi:kinesin family member 16B